MTGVTSVTDHPGLPDATGSIADDLLRNGYERWLRLEEAKAEVADDLKELMAELKGQGFAPKALRESFRRVRDMDDADKQEHDAIVDLYVASLTCARPAPTREGQSYAEEKGADRQARTSEAMDDAKALSAEAAALGLIDPEAHVETARIADAVARKYGAGVIDPTTGEIVEHEQPETAKQSLGDGDTAIGTGNAVDGAVNGADDGRDVEASGGAAPVITHSHSMRPSSLASDSAETVVPPPMAVSATPTAEQDKAGCLKLKGGQCRIGFVTVALCAECNSVRMKARAST